MGQVLHIEERRAARTDAALTALTVAMLAIAALLTFSISDYHIFNRVGEYGAVFVLSQWAKKGALLLVPMAVFFKSRKCADMAKWTIPVFALLSWVTYGDYFFASRPADTAAEEILDSFGNVLPLSLEAALFFAENGLLVLISVLLFARDGVRTDPLSFMYFAPVLVACMPLNIFENFFDINDFPKNSPWRFYSFTPWHGAAVLLLIGVTVGCWLWLRGKTRGERERLLAALAIVLLIQYHSKDSMVLGDGYNVYTTIFSCVPLFICNIGVYVVTLSIFFKTRILYSIAFFVHAAGALSVFFYFGRDEISNYGIICSYSILYFLATHILLFILCVMPTALGMYRFRFRDCIAPLVYYCIVIVSAAVLSAVVTSASMSWHTVDGEYLPADGLLLPNYAFTQINPLPFEIPDVWHVTVWRYDIDMLYVVLLYLSYAGMFFAFTGAYYAFLAARRKVSAYVRRGWTAVRND